MKTPACIRRLGSALLCVAWFFATPAGAEPGEDSAEPILADEPSEDPTPEQPPSPADDAEKEQGLHRGRKSPITVQPTLSDRQTAAARPGDFVLDPEYRGFIPIPHTVIAMKINLRPRVDMLATSAATGSEFRFVPSQFRVPGEDGYADTWRFKGNANGSQIRIEFRAPEMKGNFRLFYQNDFYGSDEKPMRYRLQHLYAQYHGLVAGFTFGLFEDPDAWPDTVDYEGPNSVVFARRALVHYQKSLSDAFSITVGIEDPDIYVDTMLNGTQTAATKRSRAPDGGLNIRWEKGGVGHAQLSSIFRSLGVDADPVNNIASQDVFGWGINLAGALDLGSKNRVQYWFVYGNGVGGMGNDTSFLNSDAAFRSDGTLVALDYWSAMGAFTHHWTPSWRSTATYGYVNLENTSGQTATDFHESHYATLNVIHQVFKRLSVGVEGMWGRKEVADGRAADVYRVQLNLSYAIFD